MMASFLSKVLGRRKGDDNESQKRRSSANLLDGPFEDVSPSVSPSMGTFPESQAEDIRGRESAGTVKARGLFRSKSRSRARSPPVRRSSEPEIPHLSLSLNPARDYKGLDALFEVDPDASVTLSDAVLGKKRLSPEEALALIQACARAIVERGLETLGIMHPHWHSASIDVQRKLISLYILSLTPSPSNAAQSAFDSELTYARDPHDVAAVFRWALRHLLLSGSSFGSSDNWYQAFADTEHTQNYPVRAFSEALVPLLPGPHRSLLDIALDLFESLSAHSEANGFSGSRLSKFLGLWLLTVERSRDGDDWRSFYERWEVAGRRLEHIFLARIRDAAALQPVPKRLTDLVRAYPYGKESASDLLPRPRFSTRTYVALLVRIDTEYIAPTVPIPHAFNTISKSLSAVEAEGVEASDELRGIWTALKVAATGEDGLPVLANIFSDATVRLLSLLPSAPPTTDRTFALTAFDGPRSPLSPTLSLTNVSTAPRSAFSRTVSTSMTRSTSNATGATTSAAPETPADWQAFTSAGFTAGQGSRLASTLFDTDVQRTKPPSPPLPVSRRSSKRASAGPRLSFDIPSATKEKEEKEKAEEEQRKSRVAKLAKVALDEAFVDFWTDAVLDGISADWPRFVLAELRPLPAFTLPSTNEPVSFVVLEQSFVRSPKPAPPPVEEKEEVKEDPVAEKEEETKQRSPRPSLASEGSRFSLSKRRFPFFAEKERDAKHAKDKEVKRESKEKEREAKHKRRASKTPKVGELGEVVKEEEEGKKADSAKNEQKAEKGAELMAAAAAGTVAGGAVVAAGVATEGEPTSEPQPAFKEVQPGPEAEAAEETPVVATGAPVVNVPMERLVESDAPEPVAVEPVQFDETPTPDGSAADAPAGSTEAAVESEPTAPEPLVEQGEADAAEGAVPDVPGEQQDGSAPGPVVEEKTTEDSADELPIDANGDSLPAAPAAIVVEGKTAGPTLALETSEPVAQAEAAEREATVDEVVIPDKPAVAEPQAAEPEPSAVAEEPAPAEEDIPIEERPPSPVAEVLNGIITDVVVDEVAPEEAAAADELSIAPVVEAPEEPAVEVPIGEAPQLDVSAPEPEVAPMEAEAEDTSAEPEAPQVEPAVDVVPEPAAESSDLPVSTSEADTVVEEPPTAADSTLEEPIAAAPSVAESAVEEPVVDAASIEEPAEEDKVEPALAAEETVPEPVLTAHDIVPAAEPEPILESVPIVEATPVSEAPLVQPVEETHHTVAPIAEEVPAAPVVETVEHAENIPTEPELAGEAAVHVVADEVPPVEDEIPHVEHVEEVAPPADVESEVQPIRSGETAPHVELVAEVPADAVPDVEDVIPATAGVEPAVEASIAGSVPELDSSVSPTKPEAAEPAEPEPAQPEESAAPIVKNEPAAEEVRVPTPIPEDEVTVEHVASDSELAPLKEKEPAAIPAVEESLAPAVPAVQDEPVVEAPAVEEAPIAEEAPVAEAPVAEVPASEAFALEAALIPEDTRAVEDAPTVENTPAHELAPVIKTPVVEDAVIPEVAPAPAEEEPIPEPPAEAHIPVEEEADAEEPQPTAVPDVDEPETPAAMEPDAPAPVEEAAVDAPAGEPEVVAPADETVEEQAVPTPKSETVQLEEPSAAPVIEDALAAEDVPAVASTDDVPVTEDTAAPPPVEDAVPVKEDSEEAEPLSPSAENEPEDDEAEPATPATPTAGEPTSPASKSAKKKGKKSKGKRK